MMTMTMRRGSRKVERGRREGGMEMVTIREAEDVGREGRDVGGFIRVRSVGRGRKAGRMRWREEGREVALDVYSVVNEYVCIT